MNLQELQILGQLLDSMDLVLDKLEKSYQNNDSEGFNLGKKEFLNMQKKIEQNLK